MRSRILVWRLFVLLVLAAMAWSSAPAGETEKKFRLGVAFGGMNAQDEILSDAGNSLTLVDEQQQYVAAFVDPRNQDAVFGALEIKAGAITTLYAQYGVNSWFLVEASVGYQKTDLGDAEVQAQLSIFPPPDVVVNRHNYLIRRVPVGELTRVPIQLTALAHFRPHASFDPYFGLGIGYSVIGFEPSAAFNELSQNLDAARGAQQLLDVVEWGGGVIPFGPTVDLTGATVDARDTFEWHIAGGAELAFKRKWSAFVDLRYLFGSRDVTVGFNGSKDLGIAVPQLIDYYDPEEFYLFGPVQISSNGLIDFGQEVPDPAEDPDADCDAPGIECHFEPIPDGILDVGRYYIQGGRIQYDAVSLQIGIRLTF